MPTTTELFTIGHSSAAAERIVDLLRQHGVALLVDVRSVPRSRFCPHFNRDRLAATLEAAGIAYLYAGQDLGGRPADPACYDDGQVRYDLLGARPSYRAAIDRLIATAGRQRTAILCAEEDPARCHRHHLIAQTLLQRGVVVWHIRGDGRLERAQPDVPPPRQLPLL